MLVTFLKMLDDDSLSSDNKRKRYTKIGLGAVSSGFYTFALFEACIYFNLPVNFSLAIAGSFSFLGADLTSRVIVKILEQKLKINLKD